MNNEQIVTIITSILETGGIVVFVWFLVKGIYAKLNSLEKVVITQKEAINALQARSSDAEKVANLYKDLVSDLPELLKKQKQLTNDIKDDIIHEQEKKLLTKDEAIAKLEKIKSLETTTRNLSDKSKLIMGLDIGSNSIGFALIDKDTNKIVELGTRIFTKKDKKRGK